MSINKIIVVFALAGFASACGAAAGNTVPCGPLIWGNGWTRCPVATADTPEPAVAQETEIAPAPEDPPEERVKVTEEKIEITERVQFETGSAELLDESTSLLDEVAKVMNEHPEITRVRVDGHTDTVGGSAMNRKLSQRRAKSVRAYLISAGVQGKRLQAKGFGLDKPIADNETEEGRYQNRRVEFSILERGSE
jgi:outer membrane protein OmpA-like peptidoglycan-associated protein